MGSFFSGWIGYGAALIGGALQEPSDNAYSRRQIQFSSLENQVTFDVGGGTVGPAIVSWGLLTFGALFDAQSGGSMLLSFPLLRPVTIGAAMTYTTSAGANVLMGMGLSSGPGTQAFPAGTIVGSTPDGRNWTTGVAVQVSGGVLSSQALSFGANVTMASLPAQAPSSGTGQLWNNGGMISVA